MELSKYRWQIVKTLLVLLEQSSEELSKTTNKIIIIILFTEYICSLAFWNEKLKD